MTHLLALIVKHGSLDAHCLRHPYTVIVTEGLDSKLERFVVIKELMHCYFNHENPAATDSEILLEAHLRQFFGKSASTPSAQVTAEYEAFWMALGVLCPERVRIDWVQRLDAEVEGITVEEISDMLHVPVSFVRLLLSDQFEDEIRAILN